MVCRINWDKVVQGKGTSYSSNVRRRLFEHAEEVSEITDIDKILLDRFNIIFCVLAF
jgi:hypothetical protein